MRTEISFGIDGTAALKPVCSESAGSPLKGSVAHVEAVRFGRPAHGAHAKRSQGAGERFASAFRDVLESSEMYCSLKLEDFRGCPYGVFSKEGIAALSSASALVGVLSVALGA